MTISKIETEIIYNGEETDVGTIVARLSSSDEKLWVGNIPSETIVYLRLDDKDTGDISREGFKIEVLMSGSHQDTYIWQDGSAYIRLYERGSEKKSPLDNTESSDDIVDGWGKYFTLETDIEEGAAFKTVYRQNFFKLKNA